MLWLKDVLNHTVTFASTLAVLYMHCISIFSSPQYPFKAGSSSENEADDLNTAPSGRVNLRAIV